jgi:hypothetical protein
MDVFTSKKFKLIFVFRFICLDFTRCLCSLKTPQCNRIRHPTYVTIEYVLKLPSFLTIRSMCVMRNLLAQKTKLITTNGFSFVVIYCACASLMVLVQIFAARGPAHMKSALRSFEGFKNQNMDNKNACFILTYFFLILFPFNFYSSPSINQNF